MSSKRDEFEPAGPFVPIVRRSLDAASAFEALGEQSVTSDADAWDAADGALSRLDRDA